MIRAGTFAGILVAAFVSSSMSPASAQTATINKPHHAAKSVSALLAEGNIAQPQFDAGLPYGYENSYVTNGALPSTAAVSTPFMSDRFYALPRPFNLP